MAFYVLSAQESSVFEFNRPGAVGIENALGSIPLPAGVQWVGPRTRITRKGIIGAVKSFLTTFARVISVEPDSDAAQQIARQIDQALPKWTFIPGDWTPVIVVPYSEAVNGPVGWWQSGEASVTRTRDDFLSEGLQHFAADDNPVGPNSPVGSNGPVDRPPTQGEALQSGASYVGNAVSEVLRPINQASGNVVGLVVVGAAIVGLAIAWPYIRGARTVSQTTRKQSR